MRLFLIIIVSIALAACVSTSEVQLSQNVYQIQASSQGALGRGKTANALLKRAAELTLEKGYTHFILGVPQTSGQTSNAGFTPIQANVIGNSVFVSGGQPINVYRETSVVLVAMSRSPAGGALDAATVVASTE